MYACPSLLKKLPCKVLSLDGGASVLATGALAAAVLGSLDELEPLCVEAGSAPESCSGSEDKLPVELAGPGRRSFRWPILNLEHEARRVLIRVRKTTLRLSDRGG